MSALKLSGVGKRFGGLEAVADLSLSIEPGVVTGLIGPNGAGKSTIVNLITGILAPTAGHISIGEVPLARMEPNEVARAGVARTFQNVRLLRETSVRDNIVIGCHRHERTSLLANLFGMPAVWRERRDFRARASKLLEDFGMTRYADMAAGGLSYGHQRRVEVMRALAMEPKYLLLDEPVAGMSDDETERTGELFLSLAGKHSLVVVEHDMAFVAKIARKVTVLHEGSVIAEGALSHRPEQSRQARESAISFPRKNLNQYTLFGRQGNKMARQPLGQSRKLSVFGR